MVREQLGGNGSFYRSISIDQKQVESRCNVAEGPSELRSTEIESLERLFHKYR